MYRVTEIYIEIYRMTLKCTKWQEYTLKYTEWQKYKDSCCPMELEYKMCKEWRHQRGEKGKGNLTSLVLEELCIPHGATEVTLAFTWQWNFYSRAFCTVTLQCKLQAILHCSHHMPSPVVSQNVLCLSISPNAMNNYSFKSFIQLGSWPDMKM